MGVVGSDGGTPASATKLAPNKGGVGFAGDLEMIHNKDKKSDDNQQLVNDNTALNSGTSLQVTLASLKKIISFWTISQHKPRLSASAVISGAIWKRIKSFEDVGEVQSTSTKFQRQWAEFDDIKYYSTTPILKSWNSLTV